jgi:hypothetical protein
VTPWERLQEHRREIEERRHRRKAVGPRQQTRWQDRRLDERTAKAIAAVMNGIPRRRPVAAVAAETPDGWAVLVQRSEGGGDVERLVTLGDCAPLLVGATMARRTPRWTGDDGRLAPPATVDPGPTTVRQVREALEEATGGPAPERDRGAIQEELTTDREGT